MCVCVCVCARARARACERASVRTCVRVCVRAHAHARVYDSETCHPAALLAKKQGFLIYFTAVTRSWNDF